MSSPRRDSLLVRAFTVAASLAILFAGLTVLWAGFRSPSTLRTGNTVPPAVAVPSKPVRTENANAMGNPAAPVALIIFADFHCPYCGSFARDTMPTIVREYVQPGKVRVFFRHVPFTGPLGRGASVAALCAERQGRFWEMHDALFAFPLEFDPPALLRKGESIGLDRRAFEMCFGEPGPTDLINLDVAIATGLGITYTPVFFLGKPANDGAHVAVSSVISGAQPITRFRLGLDRLISH